MSEVSSGLRACSLLASANIFQERHIAINRFGRGATRQTDATWSWPVFWQVITRPSTIIFFVAYVCVLIVATSLGTFLPVIFNTVSTPNPRPVEPETLTDSSSSVSIQPKRTSTRV
jgi:hypothetical protein